MKKIILILTLIALNCFTACDTNDNTFYNDVFVNVPDLVRVEVPLTGYHVNDKIYVSCSVDRLLGVPGQTNLLDVRETTGNASAINFTYLLERRISPTEWELVNIAPSAIDVTAGTIVNGSFYLASATFNGATDSYNFRAGIPLLTAGEYRLSFGYNSTSVDTVELRSDSVGNNLFLNINTTEDLGILDNLGYYNFLVL